jgi:hypothetical protein
VSRDEAKALLDDQTTLRIRAALDALADGRGPAELEDGRPPRGSGGTPG